MHQAFALVLVGAALVVASWILWARFERDQRLERAAEEPWTAAERAQAPRSLRPMIWRMISFVPP